MEIHPSNDLARHVAKTYTNLRIGMGILAFAFPLALVLWGYVNHIELQHSLSAYDFGLPAPELAAKRFPGVFPTRPLFCGILWAIGAFLILYRGFSVREDWALNTAGFAAILVAMCPMNFDYGAGFAQAEIFSKLAIIHTISAIVLFFCMAFVAWACADDTLGELPPADQQKYGRKLLVIYKTCAVLMAIFPFVTFGVIYFIGQRQYFVIAVEAIGVWIFSVFWLAKSFEISLSQLEAKALRTMSGSI